MTNNQTPQVRPTITVLQHSPFNGRELRYLRTRGNGDLNLQPLYVPLFYRGLFSKLAAGTQTLSQFLQGSDYNVSPTSDNQPFFFDLTFDLPEGLTVALRYAILLTIIVLAVAAFIYLPRRSRGSTRNGLDTTTNTVLIGTYMSLLGIGFMCIEIPLIQRFILILGQPTIAVAVVVAALLVAGGIGSALSGLTFAGRVPVVVAPLAVVAVAALALWLVPQLQTGLLSLSSSQAIAASVLLLVPLGLVLGVPFPLGLNLAAQRSPDTVALFWTVNAVFSVLGSAVAALLGVKWGFNMALAVGAGCYGASAIALLFATAEASREVDRGRARKLPARIQRRA